MLVHENINELPRFRNPVLTIGTFDGVHAGHRQIIAQLKQEAEAVNGESLLITFSPHPRMVLKAGGAEIKLLNTLDEKIDLLNGLGIDHMVVVPFTPEFSEQPASDYIETFLVKNFHPHTIIIGYDHHFGKDRKGNYMLLERSADSFNFRVKEIPKHVLHHVGISSTKIRDAISNHDIRLANEFLGYNYFFSGKVVMGQQLGRTIGFPTANIQVLEESKLVPANGVYAVTVSIKREYSLEPSIYKGMMNIGFRPTVDGQNQVIEVNLFDFESDLYETVLKVHVIEFIREEKKFEGLEHLRRQLEEDRQSAQKILENIRLAPE